MNPLPFHVSNLDLIAFIDERASLLEGERYVDAFAYTDHIDAMGWNPALMMEVIKGYGEGNANQTVTLAGQPDIVQRKEVTRWNRNASNCVGEIWYDLNIDGLASDLTATFLIESRDDGLIIRLNDIHVM